MWPFRPRRSALSDVEFNDQLTSAVWIITECLNDPTDDWNPVVHEVGDHCSQIITLMPLDDGPDPGDWGEFARSVGRKLRWKWGILRRRPPRMIIFSWQRTTPEGREVIAIDIAAPGGRQNRAEIDLIRAEDGALRVAPQEAADGRQDDQPAPVNLAAEVLDGW